jgi:hypothetical protein
MGLGTLFDLRNKMADYKIDLRVEDGSGTPLGSTVVELSHEQFLELIAKFPDKGKGYQGWPLIQKTMHRNLRKALLLMALLLLLAALFAIQKQIYCYRFGNFYAPILQARQLTFFWSPFMYLTRDYIPDRYAPLRTELDWESCTLEFVIIVVVSFFYFAWLDGWLSLWVERRKASVK